MAGIGELARFDGFRQGDDEAEEVAEGGGGVENGEVIRGADSLGGGGELVGESEGFHPLGVGDGGAHDDFPGVGGGGREVDGGEADGDVDGGGGGGRGSGEGGGSAAVDADGRLGFLVVEVVVVVVLVWGFHFWGCGVCWEEIVDLYINLYTFKSDLDIVSVLLTRML